MDIEAIKKYKEQIPPAEPTPKQMHRKLVEKFFNDKEGLTNVNLAKEEFDNGNTAKIEKLYNEHILRIKPESDEQNLINKKIPEPGSRVNIRV